MFILYSKLLHNAQFYIIFIIYYELIIYHYLSYLIHNTRNSSKKKPIDKRHVTVKQPIGLRDWHSAINKALYPFKGRDQEADNKITRQISRFQSLDPEERNATDVEQIYQVRWLKGRWTNGLVIPG